MSDEARAAATRGARVPDRPDGPAGDGTCAAGASLPAGAAHTAGAERSASIAHTDNAAHAADAVALLRELVAIPSVSGSEEACRDHLGSWLDARGIATRTVGRNLLAVVEGTACTHGDTPPARLLLCSHYDVVPVGDGWTRPPWDAALVDGRVHGRGSNDAKSSVAAMAVAATALDASTFAGHLALAFVCDEETGGEGIEACLDELVPCDAVVVGEPTGLDVCPGQRGLLRAEIVARGRACHASRPWEGVNALSAAARDVVALDALAARLPELGGAHELLGCATLAATVIAGGTRANVVPGECRVQIDGRSTPGCDNERLVALLREVLESELVVRSERMRPVVTPPSERIVQTALAASPTGRLRGFGGVSDLVHLRHLPGVVMGPGTSAASHAPDEWVAVEQVLAAVTAYTAIARAFLGAHEGPRP